MRDLDTQMYACCEKPNKAFCNTVAELLVEKYSLMKDKGEGVTGHVSKSFGIDILSWNNHRWKLSVVGFNVQQQKLIFRTLRRHKAGKMSKQRLPGRTKNIAKQKLTIDQPQSIPNYQQITVDV